MTNTFTLMMAIATLITGILWCLKSFQLSLSRRRLDKKNCDDIVSGSNTLIEKMSYTSPWIESCASLFPILLLVFIIRSFIFEPFQIPSGSMMPTLLSGDFILVEKFAYGIKDPITHRTLIEIAQPKRGDIVVFKYPLNPHLDYIKRVVGLPGDRITYDFVNKRLMIQPSCDMTQDCTKMLPIITYSECFPSNFVQTLNLSNHGKISSRFLQISSDKDIVSGIRLSQCKESLDGVMHNVLIVPGQQDQLGMYYQQPGNDLAEWVVLKGEYFMMGDNRDNSADSRYWGFVSEKNIIGKATAIWMSLEKESGKWPRGIRVSRIGAIH